MKRVLFSRRATHPTERSRHRRLPFKRLTRPNRRHLLESLEDRRLLAAGTINHAPTFTASNPPAVLEDSGLQNVVGFATFDAGDPTESSQNVLAYNVANVSNAGLFAVPPSIDTSGNLSYTPTVDAYGSSTFEVTVQDDGGTAGGGADTSAVQTLTISVTGVNDAPTLSLADEVFANEDSGPQAFADFVSGFHPGPNEMRSSTDLQVLHDEGADGMTNPLSADNADPTDLGALAFGSNIVRGVVEAAQGVGNVDVFTFTVDPGFQLEGLYALDYRYFTPPSNPNERNAFLAIDDSATFPYNAFELDFNQNPFLDETAFLGGTVFGLDDIPSAGGGNLLPRAGVITGSGFSGPLPAGIYTIYIQQTGPVSAYSLDFQVTEVGNQTLLQYAVSNISDASLFNSIPSVDRDGNLTFESAIDRSGTVTFEVTSRDNGGVDDGGVDTSLPITGTITIRSVNDAPTFSAEDPPAVLQNAGSQTVIGFASGFDPGAPDESAQSLVGYSVDNVSNPSLFSSLPTVQPDGTLAYTPAAGSFGTSTFEVTVQDDGGTANSGIDTSDSQTFTIEVVGPEDFGDAPAGYPVAFADGGPRHALSSLFLGSTISVEADGQPSAAADADDDDGVVSIANLVVDATQANSSSFQVVTSEAGNLRAWIDFDNDKVFSDDELIASTALSAGASTISFEVPSELSDVVIGNVAARFRLSSDSLLRPTGAAPDGEVEDYLVNLQSGDISTVVSVGLVDAEAEISLLADDILVRDGSQTLFRAPTLRFGLLNVQATDLDTVVTLDYAGGDPSRSAGLVIVGGFGNNTLRTTGGAGELDWFGGSDITVANFSTIDLSSSSVDLVSIEPDGVRQLSSVTGVITVIGGENNTLRFRVPDEWRMSGTSVVDGQFVRTAVSTAGGGETVEIQLPHAWQNVIQISDVNNNGDATAADALRIINELARREFSDRDTQVLVDPATVESWPGVYFDQNGDDKATALDALRVINELARVGSGEAESVVPAVLPVVAAIDDVLATRRDWSPPQSESDVVSITETLDRIASFTTPDSTTPDSTWDKSTWDRAIILAEQASEQTSSIANRALAVLVSFSARNTS